MKQQTTTAQILQFVYTPFGLVLLALLAASSVSFGQSPEPVRTWDLQSGIELKGKLMTVDPKHQLVMIQGDEGKSYLHMPQLSRADRKYVESYLERQNSEQKERPGQFFSSSTAPEREFVVVEQMQEFVPESEPVTQTQPVVETQQTESTGMQTGTSSPAPVESSLSETVVYSNEPEVMQSETESILPGASDVPWGTTVPGRRDLVTSPYNPQRPLVPFNGAQPGYLLADPNYGDRLFRIPLDYQPPVPQPEISNSAVNNGGLPSVYSSTGNDERVIISTSQSSGAPVIRINNAASRYLPSMPVGSDYSFPGQSSSIVEFDANGIIR